jgi:hypothetical protein
MAKKITVTGKPARRIELTGKPRRRVERDEFASALGAEAVKEPHASSVDSIALAALGSRLIERLRSTGGRPALADATEICRVPLSAEDLNALEKITAEIEQRVGKKSSVGQVIGVIVRDYLTRRPTKLARAMENAPTKPSHSFAAWVPRLTEIEAAIKQIKRDIEAAN